MTLRGVALTVAVLALLAGCSAPNKAADYDPDATPAPVVQTSAPAPVVTTVKPAATATSPVPVRSSVGSKPKAKPIPKATTTEPEDVYYANCSEVRAAGAAPIHAGEPGYSRKLDRDGDGTACE